MSALRFPGLDVLRGVLLVLMAVSHLPTRFRAYSHDFWGVTSAAEGFVLVAAFLAGLLHSQRARTRGFPAVRQQLFARAFELYRVHLALFTLAVMLRHARHRAPGLEHWLWFHLEQPLHAMAGATLLLYCPALFDILPMYIAFLCATPFILEFAMSRGFRGPLVASVLLWGAAQCGVVEPLRAATFGWLGIPAAEMGAFQWSAWQLLWVVGLWLGVSVGAAREHDQSVPAWALVLAFGICALCLAGRYGLPAFDLSQRLPQLVDKWRLAPLRIANLFCLALLAVRFGPPVARWAGMRLFSRLGRASLRVFLAHLVMCVLVALVVDDAGESLTLSQELAILGATLLAMVAVTLSRAELRWFSSYMTPTR